MAQAMFARELRRKRSPDEDENKPAKKRKTAADASRDYRQRLKEDTEFYASYRKYENSRVQTYRATMSEEKRAEYREKTKERVRKFRAKQRAEGKENKPSKVKTRREQEVQRLKWRDEKRMQYTLETEEQRKRRNEKRREKYAEKKKVAQEKENPKPMASSSSYQTHEALRKATYRAKKAMPVSKEKKVDVIAKLVASATPKSKQTLREKLSTPKSKKNLNFAKVTVSAIKEKVKSLSKKKSSAALKQKRTLVYSIVKKYKGFRQIRQELGVSFKFIKKLKESKNEEEASKRKSRKDAMPKSTQEKVVNFFMSPDVSRSLGDARSAKKVGGDLVARRVMERSMESAHKQFSEENPNTKVSLPGFSRLRPREVMPCTKNKKRDCLCEYCANIDLKLDAIRKVNVRQGLGGPIFQDRFDASRQTLCNKAENDTGEYKRQCLERDCNNCGVDNINPMVDQICTVNNVQYHRWEIIDIGGGKKRMTRVTKNVDGQAFVNEFKEELRLFSRHLFDASWQGRQYDTIAASPPVDHVILCQDYAENFTLRYQDEAQGAHWGYEQVTLHATVASYTCREEGCTLTTPVSEAVVFVTDDHKHDNHAIHYFDKLLHEHLSIRAGDKPFNTAIIFSDGAPTQYKNKNSFADLSYSELDFGINGERHFFGSRHGKGPCDREFGTLKKAVVLSINNRKAELDKAEDFFRFCRDNLTRPKPAENHRHYRRKFIFVSKEDLKPERDRARMKDLKPVPSTRRQHCVKAVEPNVVSHRERSCFCEACQTGAANCPNTDITGEWNVAVLKKHLAREQRQQQVPGNMAADQPQSDDEPNQPQHADAVDAPGPDNLDASLAPVQEVPGNVTADQPQPNNADQPQSDDEPDMQHVDPPLVDQVCGQLIENRDQFKVNDFVAVKFLTKTSKVAYFGKVIDKDNDDICIEYLQRKGTMYLFPKNPEESWQSVDDIICHLPTPETVACGARTKFKFCETDKLKEKLKDYRLR